eukprot:5976339-Ditylum_brightwellii.AAC.1
MSAAANAANGADPAIEDQWGWGVDVEETMEEGPPEEVPMEVDKGEEEENTEGNNNQKTVAEQIKERGKKSVEAEGSYKTSVRFEWAMP